jgi:prepilin-type N-terminal cleavage/methylation domain-containing protein
MSRMSNRRCRSSASQSGCRAGFTLVEIMIVVLIIGILLTIAVPNFQRAREQSRQKACIANLKMVDSAKEMWAMDNNRPQGTHVMLTWLIGTYINGQFFTSSTATSIAAEFKCPSSGLPYGPTMGVVGTPPQCPTVAARTGPFGHRLP